ncbi:hypothetical protein DXG03_005420 [Asterophora parasitica]|uniref:Uncharacterized protein n=1 Tax=Asterophora parasitica TaxID=117018 RepID=A0A9P7GAD9_9AGAR|nr:hypothetical protein DXG03_005420 [Asterophora parasitica]
MYSNIMLNLQEKAHFSLEEFKKGRGPQLAKYGLSSASDAAADEDDELSVLGGKTRLVAKTEPSSPNIVGRSPTSHNPVVPLPLSPSMQSQVHPSVWEYLDSFNPNQAQPVQISPTNSERQSSQGSISGASARNSFSEDVSPLSMYGLSTIPNAPTFQAEPSTYLSHQQPLQQAASIHHYPQQQSHSIAGSSQAASAVLTFPQYFPVFDYGTNMEGINRGAVNGGMNGGGYGGIMLDANPLPPGQRRASGSPEATMQSTWNDLVESLEGSGFDM